MLSQYIPVRRQGGDAEDPLAGLPIMLVLGDYFEPQKT